MSFFTALSGLNAAQTDISVTSNNIANVGTLGFHGSRAEFSDIYINTPQSRPASQVGSGTSVARLGVDFGQGSMRATGNVMDMSIQGPGFFQVRTGLEPDDNYAYTRSGAFNMNSDGYVTNVAGHYLTVFPTAENGDTLTFTETMPLRFPREYGNTAATSHIDLEMRMSIDDNGGLGTQATVPAAAFDPADQTTFAHQASVPVLNADGVSVPATAYFILADTPDAQDGSIAYSVQLVVDGEVTVPQDPTAVLSFDSDGKQIGGLSDMGFAKANGTISIDLSNSSIGRGDFGVLSVSQNGESRRALSAIEILDDGVVWASYGGESLLAVGQVAMASFSDLQGLNSIGNASYLATRSSGEVRLGAPESSGFGAVRSGSVEQANIDLTEELVHLITAQRNYQASAKALETNGKLSETIMNMRN